MFEVWKIAPGENVKVWEGSPDDITAPIAFLDTMREFHADMYEGDTLYLNEWHYAVKVS